MGRWMLQNKTENLGVYWPFAIRKTFEEVMFYVLSNSPQISSIN